MTLKMLLRLCFSSLFLLVTLGAKAAPELEIVKKARAYLGSSEKLDAVKSIHCTGTITTAGGKKMALEIIFQKPCFQRISATGPDNFEITALDDMEAWQRVQDTKDQTRWRLTLLGAEEVRRLRANTIEELGFFSGKGGRAEIQDQGSSTLNGRAVRKVAFIYEKGIVFTRFFDAATGELLRSESGQGTTIIQEGEILVDGLRFPKTKRTITTLKDGTTQTIVIEFDKITLNESFAGSFFSMPAMEASKPNAAP